MKDQNRELSLCLTLGFAVSVTKFLTAITFSFLIDCSRPVNYTQERKKGSRALVLTVWAQMEHLTNVQVLS